MTEEDFFNVSASEYNTSLTEKEGEVISFPSPSTSKEIVKRVFHTRTEFMIYPNGKIFPSKTIGWFEDKEYGVKPKEKPLDSYKKEQGVLEL